MTHWTTTFLLVAALALVGCGDGHEGHEHSADASHEEHVHTAPRGGALIVLAEETAHLELTFEPADGTVNVYSLGPHATQPVRLAEPVLLLFLYRGGEAIRMELHPVESALTGETFGDTSHFQGTDDRLKGAEKWNGHIQTVRSRGSTYEQVKIRWPPE